MMKNIEVEIRSFISDEDYVRLVGFMETEAELVRDEEEETVYFSGENDLRIQRRSSGAKIILKKGNIHDTHREENEVNFHREDFGKIETILIGAGLKVEIRWFRKRKEFLWKGVKVCVDKTKGYGNIIEIEIMSDEGDVDASKKKISSLMKELGVAQTPRYVFEDRFEYYKKNWERLV